MLRIIAYVGYYEVVVDLIHLRRVAGIAVLDI